MLESSFWTLQDRQNVVSYKKDCSCLSRNQSKLSKRLSQNELQWKDTLVQKHLTKLRHWQQILENINMQHKKPANITQGSLAYLEQTSANIPAPHKA
jgi:hypothetical protein